MCHSLFNCSSCEEYLDCLHVLGYFEKAAIDIVERFLYDHTFLFLWAKRPRDQLQSYS